MSNTTKEWFKVDREGLAKILRRKGIEFAVFELIQNAWDEKGVTLVEVELGVTGTRGYSFLRIRDDAPDGFSDLGHAYTLFAESNKKGNAEQRGRFNLGEKLVLALCRWATITTTKGTVVFDGEGRSVNQKSKREHGTVFEAEIKMTGEERIAVGAEMFKLLPARGIKTTFNGIELTAREPEQAFAASLPTELADEEGSLRKARRQTEVRLYSVEEGDTARIYEMGIPVVEHDCAFHVDVQQKVPLTLDRENVTPKFLRKLRTAVFNHAHESVTPEQATHEWAQTAIESKDAAPEAVQDYMTKRFGEKRVSYDPSDPESNKRAVSEGYTVVHGSMLSREAWSNVREHEAIKPAGKVTPSDKVWRGEGGDSPKTPPIPRDKWTPEMMQLEGYAKLFAYETIDRPITVQFFSEADMLAAASYGARTLSFNKFRLGNAWFNMKMNRLAIDDLIIHELGHEYSGDHLSEEYYSALTRIAARAVQAAREGKL